MLKSNILITDNYIEILAYHHQHLPLSEHSGISHCLWSLCNWIRDDLVEPLWRIVCESV